MYKWAEVDGNSDWAPLSESVLMERILSLLYTNDVQLHGGRDAKQFFSSHSSLHAAQAQLASWAVRKLAALSCLRPHFQLFAAGVLGFASVPAAVLCCDGHRQLLREAVLGLPCVVSWDYMWLHLKSTSCLLKITAPMKCVPADLVKLVATTQNRKAALQLIKNTVGSC